MPAVVGVIWLVAISRALAQDPASVTDARPLVVRAERLFELGNYDAALVDFSRAYALLEGYPRRYVVLHNIGACYERLFRYDEALHYYERYLSEGGRDEEDHAKIEATIAALSRMLATLHVVANVRGELWIDAQRRGQLPASVRLAAGNHQVQVRAPLHESVQRELRVEAGKDYRLQLELEPLSTYRGPDRSLFYVSATTTGVLLVAAGVLGVQTVVTHNRALARASAGMQLRTPALEREESSVEGWALATDVTLGCAALFAATSLLLYVLTDWESPARATELTTSPRARAW